MERTRPPTSPSGPFEPLRPALSLRRNVSWTVAGNVAYACFEWGMLVALAKLGSPLLVGQFGLGLAITAPIIMFANLNLRMVQATDARGEYQFADYWGLRLFTSLLALAVIVAIALAGGFSRQTALVIMAVGLGKFIASFQDIIYGLLQHHERMDRMARSMMVRGPLELAFLALGIYLTGGVLAGVLGLCLARLLVLGLYDLPGARRVVVHLEEGSRPSLAWRQIIKPSWSYPVMARLAWLALPLAFVVTLNSLNVNIPRYFVSHYLGEADLGIYVALAYVMVGGNMLVMALGLSISPRLSKYYASDNMPAFRRLLVKGVAGVVALGSGGVLLVLFIGKEFLTLCYRPEYARQVDVFFWLMVGAVAAYLATFLRHAITAARFFRVQLPSYILYNLVLVISCLLLVPTYGMLGAAWSTGIAALIILAVNGLITAVILFPSAGLNRLP
ncbi:MAG: lipopolysaccharide biosynthesis protein [Deltaproteobacteria bacterium]|nr:lipopolysaccharide biosynthesis protein [Deltaproteobacteria bacterium]MBM4287004.1 lipopolysaccharide biosynthesis protein [Deltaproteobacteria bacterium]